MFVTSKRYKKLEERNDELIKMYAEEEANADTLRWAMYHAKQYLDKVTDNLLVKKALDCLGSAYEVCGGDMEMWK
jgi:hypothetical protein